MKPKYNFFKNAKFAFEGLLAMTRLEMAFRIELVIIIPALLVSIFLPISLTQHLILVAVLVLILIAEAFNSAIEACVDLVTDKWHERAKIAKDCASAGVFLAVLLALLTWIIILGELWIEI